MAESVAAARERLDELRQTHGVYDPVMIEAWGDLAAVQAENGNHEQAAAAWEEALQISRISDGLYDTAQLRIIEQLAMAYEKAGQGEEADTYYHLLFHSRSRLHDPESLAWVDAVIDWNEWKLLRSTVRDDNIYPGALSDGELESLWRQQAEAMDVLEAHQESTGAASDDVRYGSLLHLRALTGLGMASRILQTPAYLFDPPLADRYITRRICRNVTDASGSTRQVCSTQQVENPQYRRAQVMERSQQADRSLRAARQSLSRLQAWQQHASDGAVSASELESLDSALARLEQDARRRRFGVW